MGASIPSIPSDAIARYAAILKNIVSPDIVQRLGLKILHPSPRRNPLIFAEGTYQGETITIGHLSWWPHGYQVAWLPDHASVAAACYDVDRVLRLIIDAIDNPPLEDRSALERAAAQWNMQ